MYAHLLVATDGSEGSNRAVRRGVELSRALGARVTLMTVTPLLFTFSINAARLDTARREYRRYMKKWADGVLESAAAVAAEHEVVCERVHVEERQASEAVLSAASERGCDLIVMGSHGRRGLERLLIGSEAQKVLTQSSIPVLVVPSRESDGESLELRREHADAASRADRVES